MKVEGIKKKLSHGGSIFIGTDAEDETNNNIYFEFVNSSGEITKVGLSKEAWDAVKEADKKLFPLDGWVLKNSFDMSWTAIEK